MVERRQPSSCGRPCIRCDFARAIVTIGAAAEPDFQAPEVRPIANEDYLTPARRPRYSVPDTALLESQFGLHMPDWREQLQRCSFAWRNRVE
jgi:dTDP-4-dehydrorhamnose reductase